MRELKFLLIILIISCLDLSGQEKKVYGDGYLVQIGDPMPDFTISEAGGKQYKLSDLKGKVIMLQFTASWCSVHILLRSTQGQIFSV